MRQITVGSTYTVVMKMYSQSDHITGVTGAVVNIQLSKNGGVFNDVGIAPEASNGWYKYTLSATDTNTLGDLIVKGGSPTCDVSEQIIQIVSADLASVKAKTDQITFTTANKVDSQVFAYAAGQGPEKMLTTADGIETSWTLRDALRILLSALAGPTAGMAGPTAQLKSPDGTKTRITMTVDASGNRSAPVYDKT